ncbi:hypothetical protein HAX54_016137, partial [Datura stramonium]|nr:hypothetical protein [Datura stramonium]
WHLLQNFKLVSVAHSQAQAYGRTVAGCFFCWYLDENLLAPAFIVVLTAKSAATHFHILNMVLGDFHYLLFGMVLSWEAYPTLF